MMDDKVPATRSTACTPTTPITTPSSAPPGTAMISRGSKALHAPPGDTAALTARPNASKATASFNRLSPCNTAMVRRGKLNSCSTAAAAAASGGATMAPSATAAANGNPAIAQPAHATAAVVNSTSTTANEVNGSRVISNNCIGLSKPIIQCPTSGRRQQATLPGRP
jgi:hypothetical protein